MKKLAFILPIVMVLGFTTLSNAALINRGTDVLGNRLIYDSDRNITWYDYTKLNDNWYVQMNWAAALTVNYGGNVYDDWRLPRGGQDCTGPDCTNSEMGYLYYIELHNSYHASPINTGPFEHLSGYQEGAWSATDVQYNPNDAWYFVFGNGDSRMYDKFTNREAMAVRDGNVAPVPIPPTILLLGAGLVGLFGFRRKFGK